MAYKCKICGSNEVEQLGDVCELCSISQDPYISSVPKSRSNITSYSSDIDSTIDNSAKKHRSNRKVLINGGGFLSNQDPYGNDMSPNQDNSAVKVYSSGQVPDIQSNTNSASKEKVINKNQPISSGITKNITVDNQKKSILTKWFRALFTGIPFTIDNDITMFQVFPDYTGTSLNAMGNACDQIIVYGKLNNGAINDNNDVEIFGRRDSNNNIVAKTIKNKASGTIIKPMRTLNSGVVWILTLLVLVLIVAAVMTLGVTGIIWTVVILLCLTNLPRVIKILGVIFGMLFSFIRRIFR